MLIRSLFTQRPTHNLNKIDLYLTFVRLVIHDDMDTQNLKIIRHAVVYLTNYKCQEPSDRTVLNSSHSFPKIAVTAKII